ncbi:MAG: hypothetical protein V3W11_00215 [bacterium]
MKTIALAMSLTVMGVAGAWSADVIVDGGPAAFSVPEAAGSDGAFELKWDNGTRRWNIAWYTGAGSWVGNDFDISTLGASWWIETIKVMSGASWPNGRWDGFRLGVFTFSGGLPGSRLHGPRFVRGSGPGYRWCGFNFGMWEWALGAHKRFVVAVEQYYNYPDCDPFFVDDNPTFMGHSWQYYGGRWRLFSQVQFLPYRNVMLRVIINDTIAVTPTSLGRVKALYY